MCSEHPRRRSPQNSLPPSSAGQTDPVAEDDDELPELANALEVGRFTFVDYDWWHEHKDALNEAVAVIEWEEFHIDHRSVGPVIEEKPAQRLTMTVEEAAHALGISRATAYEAVGRGEIPCIRIGRRILIPKVALEKLLEAEPHSGS